MWGVANSLNDVLIPQFRKAFQLDDFASSLVQSRRSTSATSASRSPLRCSCGASAIARRCSWVSASTARARCCSCPAAQASQYYAFLIALYVIASGLAFLETSANPLIAVMGPAEQRRPAPELRADLQSASAR